MQKRRTIPLAVALLAAFPALRAQEATTSAVIMEKVLIHGTTDTDGLRLEAPAATASRLGVPVRDIPASVFTLDQAAFQARGLRTAQEAVESVVGFTGANSAGNGATYSTRGFVGDNVAQLWDGVRLLNPAMSARPLDTFNLAAVEVIKGPASVLHGEGAVGAAINFLPKEPSRDRFTAEALASYGTWNTVRLGAGAGGPVADTGLSYRADFSRQASDTFQRDGGYEYHNFSAALRYDVSEQFALTLYTEALQDDLNAYWGVPLVNGRLDERLQRANYNVADNVMKSETYWFRLKAEWTPSDAVRVNNLAYGAVANRDWKNAEGYDYDPVAGRLTYRDLGIVEHEQSLFGDRLETLFTHELAGRENRLALGGDFKRTEFFRLADFPSGSFTTDAFNPVRPTYALASGAAGPSQRGADYTITQAGPFVEDQFALLPSLKLVAGARYDHIQNDVFNRDSGTSYGRDFNPFTYRGGVVWEVVTNTTLYGQYTTAANSPRSFVNIGGAAFGGYSFSLEKSRQFEFGAKHTGWDGRAEATLAYFDIEKDRIRTFRVGNERVGAPAGQQRSHGIELEGVLRPVAGWTLGANFTALSADIDHPGFADDGARPSNVPLQQAGVFTSYRFPFGLELGADVRYVGNRLGNDPGGARFTMDDYTVVGAYAAYAWKQFTLTVRGRNLADKTYLAWAEDDYGNQALVGAPASVEVELRASF